MKRTNAMLAFACSLGLIAVAGCTEKTTVVEKPADAAPSEPPAVDVNVTAPAPAEPAVSTTTESTTVKAPDLDTGAPTETTTTTTTEKR